MRYGVRAGWMGAEHTLVWRVELGARGMSVARDGWPSYIKMAFEKITVTNFFLAI